MNKILSNADKDILFKKALLTADWFVNSQLGDNVEYKTSWNSDRGRYLYYYNKIHKKYVPGINWSNGRGLFVCCEAYKLTGNKKYIESAKQAFRYLSAMQVMDPYYKKAHGVFKETIPQGSWGGVLDGAQAASGILMYYAVTGCKDALRRAKAFCDCLLRNWHPEEKGKELLSSVDINDDETLYFDQGYANHAIGWASTIPLWFLYNITKDKKYMEPVLFGADFILDCQRKDGAMHNVKDITKVPPAKPNHHEGRGEGDHRYVLYNDDGMMVVVMAAYEYTKDKKYLDAMTRYADWIVAQPVEERPIVAFPVRANTVLDISKYNGKNYTSWVLKYLDSHLLSLQELESDDPMAYGGFCGEDEEGEGGLWGGSSLDYVVTRTSCYAAGTLFRLSGRGTGAGFSPVGLNY